MPGSPSTSRWIAAGVCVLGVFVVARWPRPSAPEVRPTAGHRLGAYRPDSHPGARPQPALPDAASVQPLDPSARLRAAMSVMTAPPPGPRPPLPPSGPLPPALAGERRVALHAWQAEVQRTLDHCVARPEALRQQVALDVWFMPPTHGAELAPQQLAPATVSLAGAELERLWRDTDPDALQACLDRVRAQVLTVPTVHGTPARALPAAAESVLVTL